MKHLHLFQIFCLATLSILPTTLKAQPYSTPARHPITRRAFDDIVLEKSRRHCLFARCSHTKEQGSLLIDLGHEEGSTLLHYAAQGYNPTIVSELLNAGAATNLANRNGMLPIHLAAMNPMLSILRAFIENERAIDLSAKMHAPTRRVPNLRGATPLEIALQTHLDGHVLLLLEHNVPVPPGLQRKVDLVHAFRAQLEIARPLPHRPNSRLLEEAKWPDQKRPCRSDD